MTYEQALAYWFTHANYEQRSPVAADLKLDRMRALLARLGDPHRRLRVVHVAGSKGKGSVSAMLAAVLAQAGYRTGLFTSPHLVALEERFQVGGRPILPAELAQLLTEVREAIEAHRSGPLPGGPPTFFELSTALGFLHFERRRADAVVLEVGLGGRLDSTNVCLPVVSVVTSISLDHTQILGDTLALIAREKAGIIKPRRPVVSGVTAPEARAVIEEVARARLAPLVQQGADFSFAYQPGRVTADSVVPPGVTVRTRRQVWPAMPLGLLGEHQGANAAVVVATVEELRRCGWRVPDRAVARGLAEVVWPARLEVAARRPLVVLDCAHNVASAAALAEALQTTFPPVPRTLVFAGSADKDVSGMFAVLAPHFDRAYLTRFQNNPRAIPPAQLLQLWQAAGGRQGAAIEPSSAALAEARRVSSPEGLVCVAGSVFLAGELRPLLVT